MSLSSRKAAPQVWDPERYARNARFVTDLGAPVLALLAPRPGERILDLGCGDGVLAARLAAAGARVVGVDSSPAQVAAARARGVDARVMDAQALADADAAFEGAFDAVFSNAALHWMTDQDAVLAGVFRVLRPGGRFVAEMGGAGNVGAIRAALESALARRGIEFAALDPWVFPAAAAYRARLEAHGFRVAALDLFPRPTVLPGDLGAWLETFADGILRALPEGERPAVVAEVTRALAPRLRDAEGRWVADYVRLRFRAEKPGG